MDEHVHLKNTICKQACRLAITELGLGLHGTEVRRRREASVVCKEFACG